MMEQGGSFNGLVDQLIAAGKKLWILGVALTAVVAWVFSVNTSMNQSATIVKRLETQAAVQDDVLVKVHHIDRFMLDSLVTNKDMDFLLGQSLATHRNFDNRLRRLEHRPLQEGMGRGEYFPQYGPIPDKYRLWFEPRTPAEWLSSKAEGH